MTTDDVRTRMVARSQRQEAQLYIRWSAAVLTPIERVALSSFLYGNDAETARQVGLTRGGIWFARRRALEKMRVRLHQLGVQSYGDLL